MTMRSSRAAAAMAAAGGLLFTLGCGSSPELMTARAEERRLAAEADAGRGQDRGGAPTLPVMVRCGDDQRMIGRTILIDNEEVTEVQCVDRNPALASVSVPGPAFAPAPAYAPAAASFTPEVRAVPAVVTQPAPERVVVRERVVTQPRAEPARRQADRSWQKSAIIIGSSAGAGAGVGGLVGGRKGAAIGAAVGGGGAVVWDQATRRR